MNFVSKEKKQQTHTQKLKHNEQRSYYASQVFENSCHFINRTLLINIFGDGMVAYIHAKRN